MLETGLRYQIKTSLIPVEFVLAIMEIEAWFLAETNHFSNIDASLTPEFIQQSLGIDIKGDDLSLRHEPAKDLNTIYMLANKHYQKGNNQTINSLDICFMYLELTKKIMHLKKTYR